MANPHDPAYWTIDAIIVRMKAQILADVENGLVPDTCASFSELHDYQDANCYGNLCDDGQPFDAGTDRDADLINDAQYFVFDWIESGALRGECAYCHSHGHIADNCVEVGEDEDNYNIIVKILRETYGYARAYAESTGGNVWNIVIPVDADCAFRFGTADVNWSGGFYRAEDWDQSLINTATPSDTTDFNLVALALHYIVKNYANGKLTLRTTADMLAYMERVAIALRAHGLTCAVEAQPIHISCTRADGATWAFGTANTTWGGDLTTDDGRSVDAFETTLIEGADPVLVADTLLRMLRERA